MKLLAFLCSLALLTYIVTTWAVHDPYVPLVRVIGKVRIDTVRVIDTLVMNDTIAITQQIAPNITMHKVDPSYPDSLMTIDSLFFVDVMKALEPDTTGLRQCEVEDSVRYKIIKRRKMFNEL